jgi:hypothetical protein
LKLILALKKKTQIRPPIYTPQENGHIESFRAIFSRHLKLYHFGSLEELKQNLILFYEFSTTAGYTALLHTLTHKSFGCCGNNMAMNIDA